MSETSQKAIQRQPANLTALQHHLKELASRTQRFTPLDTDPSRRLQGPTLVIRGK